MEYSGVNVYERDKHVEIIFKKGEALVGQCWQEQKRIFMIEIPDISSGIGVAAPNRFAILPLIYNDAVFWVLEMATFKEFTQAEILFLEDLAKKILQQHHS